MVVRYVSVVMMAMSSFACKPKVQRDANTPAPVVTADQVALPSSTPGMTYAKNGEKLVGICQNTLVQGAESMQCAEYYTSDEAFKQACIDGPNKTPDGQIYMFAKRVGNCPEGITHGCVYNKADRLQSVVWSYNKSEKCVDESAPVPAP